MTYITKYLKYSALLLCLLWLVGCGSPVVDQSSDQETQPNDQTSADDGDSSSQSSDDGSSATAADSAEPAVAPDPSDTTEEAPCLQTTYYHDADGDGYGDPADSLLSCVSVTTYVSNSSDCDDTNASINSAVVESCDGVDNNCDGSIDEGVKSTFYHDADGDGYGDSSDSISSCASSVSYVSDSSDCNDASASIKPSAVEVCDSVDNDCDDSIDEGVKATYYRDADGDTYGTSATTTQACSKPTGYATNSTDCNDASASIRPSAAEVCDSVDNDCDGSIDEGVKSTFYHDADGDGYGDSSDSILSCSSSTSYVSDSSDCDDTSASIKPSATESCDDIDNDCDGSVDEDLWPSDVGFTTVFARSPLDIGDDLIPGYEPSGAVWHSGLNKLYTVSDDGWVTEMDSDGSNTVTYSSVSSLNGYDLEAVTVADPATDFIYLGIEGSSSGHNMIKEFNVVTHTVTRTFDLSATMNNDFNGDGVDDIDYGWNLEALTFVPDASSAQGGYFYAGLQYNGYIFVFELPIVTSTTSTTVVYQGQIETYYHSSYADLSGLSYDSHDDLLYAIYDGRNKLVAMDPDDGTFIAEWSLPSATTDQEGFAIGDSCHVFIAEDTRSVWRY